MTPPADDDELIVWLRQAQTRGLGSVLTLALDIVEPLGPLGAQLVWIVQPVLGLWISRRMLTRLAESLEAPDGVAHLRQQLDQMGDRRG